MKRIITTITILLIALSSLFCRIGDTPVDNNVFNFSLIPYRGGIGVNLGSKYYPQHNAEKLFWREWDGTIANLPTGDKTLLPTEGSGNSAYSANYSDYHIIALGGGYNIPYNDDGYIQNPQNEFIAKLNLEEGYSNLIIKKDDISLEVTATCDSDFEFVSQSNPIYRRPFEIEIIPRVAINGVGDGITTTEKIYKMNSTNNQVTIKIPNDPPNDHQGQNNVAMIAADMTLVLPYDYANYASDGGYFSGGLTYNNATYSLADASDYTAVVTITLTLNIDYSYTYNGSSVTKTYNETRVLTIPFSGFYSSAGSQDVRDDSISLYVNANSNAANLNLARQGEWINVGSIQFLYNDSNKIFKDKVNTNTGTLMDSNADIVRIFLSNSPYPFVQADSKFRMVHENATSISNTNSLGFEARIVGTGSDRGDISIENKNSNVVTFDGLACTKNISGNGEKETYDAVKTVCNLGAISNNMYGDKYNDWGQSIGKDYFYRHFHTFEGDIDIKFEEANGLLAAGIYRGYIYIHAITEDEITSE